MTAPVASPSSDGGGSLTLDDIRAVRPGVLRTAAEELRTGSGKLARSHRDYTELVDDPLQAGVAWSGHGHPEASAKSTVNSCDIHEAKDKLRLAATVLDGLAGYLDTAKKQVAGLDVATKLAHITVLGTGATLVDPVPHEKASDTRTRQSLANGLAGHAMAVIAATAQVDAKAAADLSALEHGRRPDMSFWSSDVGSAKWWYGKVKSFLERTQSTYGLLDTWSAMWLEESMRKHRSAEYIARYRNRVRQLDKLLDRPEGRLFTTDFGKISAISVPLTILDAYFEHEGGASWGKAAFDSTSDTLVGSLAGGATTEVILLSATGGPVAVLAVSAGVVVGMLATKEWDEHRDQIVKAVQRFFDEGGFGGLDPGEGLPPFTLSGGLGGSFRIRPGLQ